MNSINGDSEDKLRNILRMTIQQKEEQILPVDSGLESCSKPYVQKAFGNLGASTCDQESDIGFLTHKIASMQKNYFEMEKKYLRKIKQLKEELLRKRQIQYTLRQQITNLSRQYEEHKLQIQKVSAEVSLALEQNSQMKSKQQKQTKVKSVSPKNSSNYSPKRLIKKSLQIAKKAILEQQDLTHRKVNNLYQTAKLSQTERKNQDIFQRKEICHFNDKKPFIDQQATTITDQNSSNVINQARNLKKPSKSPQIPANGPSPKKKMLFNSSKQLNLFSKNDKNNKNNLSSNNLSPTSRKVNFSPTQMRKSNPINSNKISHSGQFKNQLAIIEQMPQKIMAKNNQNVKLNNSKGNIQRSSPNQSKKPSSLQNLRFLGKNTSRQNDTNLNGNNKIINGQKEQNRNSINFEPPLQKKQQPNKQKLQGFFKQNGAESQMRMKQKTNTVVQLNKTVKVTVDNRFSPVNKKVSSGGSPMHKRNQTNIDLTKSKQLGNIRQKFDENLFK